VEGDIVLICSDGLTNMLEDGEIREILNGKGELEGKARDLIEAANAHGGKDNIAVILIELLAQ
ncbi:MAG: serine/threonine-protein phosphatase, partial [Acetatifactor sp.]|nr:serine/threonine-protein phosphatase [Acetatifactor sp.]